MHTIVFSENFISYVKEPSHFRILEAKLWHSKTETKNLKVTMMVEFIKICDQYARRFNVGNFFNSIILIPRPFFCWGKNRSSENAARKEWVISLCLGWGWGGGLGVMINTWRRGLLGGMNKNEQIQFFNSKLYLPANLKP